MKNSEIKELSTKEVEERIDNLKVEVNRMKINHAVSPLDNPSKISMVKKDIARLKTELRKRQLQEDN